MREILFRAKRIDTGEWVYGYLGKWPMRGWKELSYFVIPLDGLNSGLAEQAEIDPTTVGQYTGLKGKEEKRIFEGDFIKFANEIFAVEYISSFAAFSLHRLTNMRFAPVITPTTVERMEVIGNIHDNKLEELKNAGDAV